ncbi:MAG: hypothetical protein JSU04_06345 [Bdellovibrionales bacterium]|nr:hypothetical protein [Bdellovibrionales bacterium]
MKIVLAIIAFFVARVAFADTTYNCTSANNDYGQLKVVGDKTLEFTPNLKTSTVYKSSVANLSKMQIPFMGDFVVIKDSSLKITGRTKVDILVSPAVLKGASQVHVIASTRDVKMISGNTKSVRLLSYNCQLK